MIRYSTLLPSLLLMASLAASACTNREVDLGGRFLLSVDLPPSSKPDRGPSVTLLEIGSYHCGACAQFAMDIAPDLIDSLLDRGQLQYKYVDIGDTLGLDLPYVLGRCMKGTMPMHLVRRWMFRAARSGAIQSLDALISSASTVAAVERDMLKHCVDSARPSDRVAEFSSAKALNVKATPTFIVGVQLPDGSLRGWPLVGIAEVDSLRLYIADAFRYKSELMQR